jgi:hypothetical protein
VIDFPPGPLPKNCGFWEVIVSPSFKLSKITLPELVEEEEAVTLNFDDWLAFWGRFRFALGLPPDCWPGNF